MLYHVTMTHSPDNCPGYDTAKQVELISAGDKLKTAAEEAKVKVHFLVWGAPEHIAFALVESEDYTALGRFLMTSLPIRQDFKVTPVQNLEDLVAMVRAMARK